MQTHPLSQKIATLLRTVDKVKKMFPYSKRAAIHVDARITLVRVMHLQTADEQSQ